GMGGDLLGKWTQLRVAMPYVKDRFAHKPPEAAPDWENATPSRFFGGIVSSVTHSAPGTYQLSIQSPLYPLTLRNHYKIYKDKRIEDLIATLLAPEMLQYNSHLKLQFNTLGGKTVTRKQDWLQAGESDFALLQRVLAKAAIHFYFIHEQDTLTLVFSNQPTSLQEVAIPGNNGKPLVLRYSYSDVKALGMQQDDLFCELKYEVKMVQQVVRTVLTRQQSVWETNEVAKYTSYGQSNGEAADVSSQSVDYLRHRCYAYGVDENEAQGQETKLCQQLSTEEGTLSGVSTSPLLSPGYTFVLAQSVVSSALSEGRMPAQFDQRTFVVTKISHKASDKESYSGTIEATEVNVTNDQNKETLITPFDMQGTQQGSVLATVLRTAVPKGWRYRAKENFETGVSSVSFADRHQREIGCIVRFATDSGADGASHWVALSPTSQNAPEVHSMVMIGRGSNESEIPEIQQVLSSHGQKTIQPPDQRSNHWTANTSWGSNYSTCYGDGISIRYGNESPVNLSQAVTIVEDAYRYVGVLSTEYGNTSFNRGSSFSFSVSDNDATGLSNASVSAGCNFSESFSDQSYNVSSTNCSQSASTTNKSVNRSFLGAITDVIDYDAPSFVNGKIPDSSIITASGALANGSSYSESYITGKSISFNFVGYAGTTFPALPAYDQSVTVYSYSVTVGTVKSYNEQTGNTTSESITTGDTTNTNTHSGNSTNTSTTTGDSTNTSITTGDSSNTSTTTGDSSNTSTTTGDSSNTSTTVGDSSNTSTTTGDSSNTSSTTGNSTGVSTTTGNSTNTSKTTGNVSNTTTMEGNTTNKSTTIGNADHTSTTTGDTTSIATTTGDTTSTSTTTGNAISTSTTTGNTTSTTTMDGNVISKSTNKGTVTSTSINDKKVTNTSTNNADVESTSTTNGNTTNTSTHTGDSTNTTTITGDSTNSNTTTGDSTNTTINVGKSYSKSLSASASESVSASVGATASQSASLSASSEANLHIGISADLKITLAASVTTEIVGGVQSKIEIGGPKAKTSANPKAELEALKVRIIALESVM
ncbi:MAG: type VI secretion system secreted protein VgrG, partial [Phenylobacterium sp.]